MVERRVPVRTIRSLIDTHAIEPPDFLSIDVEGQEAAVIRGTPLDSWRPRVLVVEATLPLTTTPSHEEWEPILLAQGYLFAAFNGLNRFYLREDLRELLDRFSTPVNVLDEFVPYEVVLQCERAADLERRLASEQDRMALDRQRYEELHRAWERDQIAWEQQRRDMDWERADLQARLTASEDERAEWQTRLTSSEAERAVDLQARLIAFEAERADLQARLTAFEAERAEWQARLI